MVCTQSETILWQQRKQTQWQRPQLCMPPSGTCQEAQPPAEALIRSNLDRGLQQKEKMHHLS